MNAFWAKYFPAWHSDPATQRQLKVLRLFRVPHPPDVSKGRAGSMIGRLFSDPAKKHLWAAYVYTTGDEDSSTSDLRPHDLTSLANVRIPENWQPRARLTISKEKRKACETLISDLLRDGSPFDDPLPEISVSGTSFAFTGKFQFGSRSDCQQAVVSRGGTHTEGVTAKTDVLVIGTEANPAWSHGSYGNKIEYAMVLRIQHGKPTIISEEYWRQLLS